MKKSQNQSYAFLICAGLVLTTIIAYEPIRHNDFVNYDDNLYVTENPNVKSGLTLKSVIWAFTSPHSRMWHPLTSLSHMLDCHLFGLNSFWHHLTNLLFHTANTLLLFWILKRMTGEVWLCAFVAAVFALHPLQVESVAWVAERKNVLSCFFWMLTIAAYIRYAESPGVGKYLLVVFTLCLGLMSKPMVVTLPFVLLLLDYWPLGRLKWKYQSDFEAPVKGGIAKASYQKVSAWHLFREKLPLLIPVAILSVATFIVQLNGAAVKAADDLPLNIRISTAPLIVRISNALVSYPAYIGKMMYPTSLSVLYPHPRDSMPVWQPTICLVVLAGISVWTIYMAQRHRYLVVGWLWYLGTLIPVIGLVQVGAQAMADRYTYLPSIGVVIMVAWGTVELFGKWQHRKITLGLTSAIVLTLLLTCTRLQLRHWQNNSTLFGHAVRVTENNFVMHTNLGITLLDKGQTKEAVMRFNEALRINPYFFRAFYYKAKALLAQGKLDEAIAIFTELVRSSSELPEIYDYLGQAYARKGQFKQAIKHYKEALQLKPDYPEVYNDLGIIYCTLGKYDLAIKSYNYALQFRPDYPEVAENLRTAMQKQAGIKEAAKERKKVP